MQMQKTFFKVLTTNWKAKKTPKNKQTKKHSAWWGRVFKEGFRNIDAKKVSVDKKDAGNMEMLKVKVANGENVKPGTWLHKSSHRDWQIEDSEYWEQGDWLLI